MNYGTYTDEDVLEIHNSMLEYSGKADDAIMLEIESPL